VELAGEADATGPDWLELGRWAVEDLVDIEEQFAYGYAMGAWSKSLLDDVPTTERFIGIVPDGLLAGNMAPGQEAHGRQ
jgi:Zn ribbon nucleic-acid-binding protein